MPKVDRQPTRDERADATYLAYLEAKRIADETHLIRDYGTAVRLWNAFVELGFETGAAREDLLV